MALTNLYTQANITPVWCIVVVFVFLKYKIGTGDVQFIVTGIWQHYTSDKFVQQYIIGQGDKANFADVKNLFNTIRRDPQAMDAARQSVMTFLKGKALNGAADEVGNFSPSAYKQRLRSACVVLSPQPVTKRGEF